MTTSTIIARTNQDAVDLARELERRARSAIDLVLDRSQWGIHWEPVEPPSPPRLFAHYDAREALPLTTAITPTARSQITERCGIPGDFGRRLFEQFPDLFTTNVNRLLPEGRSLLRILDGATRAVLSDRYRVLDNHDLFFTAFREAQAVGAQTSRATLTDDGFELRFIVPDWAERIEYQRQSGAGRYHTGHSEFAPGVYIRNSETGRGGLVVSPFILDLVCSNGMIAETRLRQVHLGSRLAEGILSQEAADADAQAIWLRVRDLIRATFDRDGFAAIVRRLAETGQWELANPVAAVNLVARNAGLTDSDRQAILNELISPAHDRTAGNTVLGLLNAITQHAQTYETSNPDKATALETFAGQLLGDEALVYARATVN